MTRTVNRVPMKDQNYWKVLDAVIRLEVTKGHLLWKITELSRLSGVGRPLIYYYFGKSKEEIVQAALKIIGDEFFGLSEERVEMWKRKEVAESVLRTRELMSKAPHVSVFFFHWRYKKGEIADHLRELEQRYRAKLASLMPGKSEMEMEAAFAALFGLTLLPELQEDSVRALIQKMGLS